MHPLLLFTLFFISGIKSHTFLATQDHIHIEKNEIPDSSLNIPNTDVINHNDNSSPMKFENNFKNVNKYHHNKKYREDLSFKPSNNEEALISKNRRNRINLKTHEDNFSAYRPTPSPSSYYKEEKFIKNKSFNKNDKKSYFSDKKWEVYKDTPSYGYDKKYLKNEKKIESESKWPVKKMYTKNKIYPDWEKLSKDNMKVDNDMFGTFGRDKREIYPHESDESFHGGSYDDEIDSHEEESDDSLEKFEKHIMAHLLAMQDDSHPYTGYGEVDYSKKSNVDEKIPVVEEVITKKRAYSSCNNAGDDPLGCHLKRTQDNANNINKEEDKFSGKMLDTKNMEESKQQDEAAWLRELEQEIMDSGIDVVLL